MPQMLVRQTTVHNLLQCTAWNVAQIPTLQAFLGNCCLGELILGIGRSRLAADWRRGG